MFPMTLAPPTFCTDSPLQRALKPERILYRELFRLRVRSSLVRIEPDYSIPGNASNYASPRTCSPLLQTSLCRIDFCIRFISSKLDRLKLTLPFSLIWYNADFLASKVRVAYAMCALHGISIVRSSVLDTPTRPGKILETNCC